MSIWYKPIDVEKLNQLMCQHNMLEHLDITFTEIGDNYIVGRMPVDWRTHQPAGILHGGASVVLAETLGSVAANLCSDMARYAWVGQEINANHLRGKSEGWLTGTARPLHLGKRSQVWEIQMIDEQERLICVSRLTMARIEKRGDGGAVIS